MIPGNYKRSSQRPAGDDILTLTPADLRHLHLRDHPRLRPGDAESLVIQAPGLSKWHPASGEFVIVTPWRHRTEIPSVNVLSAFLHEKELLAAAFEGAEEQGAAAFVIMDAFEIRRPMFYERNRLEKLESILTYEHRSPDLLLQRPTVSDLRFEPWFGGDEGLLDALVELDHNAFPWLWRNSREEFLAYGRMPFVEVWLGWLGDRLVSYYGITHFRRWSHLDRIAIVPDVQGQGLGGDTLRHAVRRMMEIGAERVGLSTQKNNRRSRQMYEKAGFVETPDLNYDIWGILFEEGRRHMPSATGEGTSNNG